MQRRSGGRKGSIVVLDRSFAASKGVFLHPSFFFFFFFFLVDYGMDGIWGG